MAIRAYAASDVGAKFDAREIELPPLGDEDVEIEVEHCGICHSDLSMLGNEWRSTQYPFVGGHEVVGRVVAAGAKAKRVAVGDRVGLGWCSSSCMACDRCLSGEHHLCPNGGKTIVGRPGGFAERVRCHWVWAVPVPAALDPAAAAPLFCGGVTVFSPMVGVGVHPLHRVGVVGIGGLGHIALQFLRAFGCEVWAFTTNPAKADEAKRLGAHHVVATHDAAALKRLANTLDFVIATGNATLDWNRYLGMLAPHGRLHVVGAVLEELKVSLFALMRSGQSLSSSPVGSPVETARMLEFAARHGIAPVIERSPMSGINDAMDRLRAGKARYRLVLDADFGPVPGRAAGR